MAGADGAGAMAVVVARGRTRRDAQPGRRRITWRTALPYTLTFVMRVTRVEPMTLIEGRAEGELDGLGRWTLTADGGRTHVRYDWIVEVTRPWMRIAAPVLGRCSLGTTAW